jgi:tight adherence protein C
MENIPIMLLVAVGAVFVLVLVVVWAVTNSVVAKRSPERKRLQKLTRPRSELVDPLIKKEAALVKNDDAEIKYVKRYVPKSPKELSRIRRRLMRAGYKKLPAVIIYVWIELSLPVILGLASLYFIGTAGNGLLIAGFLAVLGYLAPGLVLSRKIEGRKRELQNGLPDALDLLIVCVESGSSLDQAVLKTAQELGVSYPQLADEFETLNIEVRAGKPRIEAFRNLASRTGLDDMRSLVAMLVQTDRFGTSVAQALRTHAVTLRAKRRQRAEEKAAKIGVKMVFPLVFFLFPAFYAVTLGPAVIQFSRVFFGQVVQ